MRKLFCGFALAGFCHIAFSQDIEKEVNEQLWKPFLKASSEFDGEAFMALQSRDFIRVSLDSKEIHDVNVYEKSILPNFKRIKNEGKVLRNVEMRFLERVVSPTLAYETGYFKSVTTLASGEVRTRYTKFYIISRKESGAWRILVDSDSNDGGTITEEMFQAAKPME